MRLSQDWSFHRSQCPRGGLWRDATLRTQGAGAGPDASLLPTEPQANTCGRQNRPLLRSHTQTSMARSCMFLSGTRCMAAVTYPCRHSLCRTHTLRCPPSRTNEEGKLRRGSSEESGVCIDQEVLHQLVYIERKHGRLRASSYIFEK
jgi:hypothetical protein